MSEPSRIVCAKPESYPGTAAEWQALVQQGIERARQRHREVAEAQLAITAEAARRDLARERFLAGDEETAELTPPPSVGEWPE